MSTELAVVLGLLIAAIVMFAINRPRMDAVALIMLTVLPFTGVVTMSETLAGFSDPNVVLIAALFVIGEGLVRTGVARQVGDWLQRRAGSSPTILIILLTLVVCGLGATMSSTAVTAIFIPIAMRIARSTGTSPGQLMMPISFAALISGMTTLVATAPNLVVNSELTRHGHPGFHFFAFTPFGAVVLVLGVFYMLVARHWLPTGKDPAASSRASTSLAEWVDYYKLADREYRVRILSGSPIVGKSVQEIDLPSSLGLNIIAIERRDRFSARRVLPPGQTVVQADDVLLIDRHDPNSDVTETWQRLKLEELPLSGSYFNDHLQDIGLAELIVPADSTLIDKSIVEAEIRARYGLTVIGLRHGKTPLEEGLLTEKIKVGDTLLVIGKWKTIRRLTTGDEDLLVLNMPRELEDVLPAPGRAIQAVACLLLVVGLMVSGIIPNVQAALIGCLLMGLFGCVDLASGYHSINWKTIVLIVGMLPFSMALQRTGGVELAADAMMSALGDAGSHAVLASLFLITALLGLFISNTATAVLMSPVALAIAQDMNASPYPFAMIVALAASTAFVTPVSSPVNTLVVGPGNYSFFDFVRVGAPFAVIVMIVSVILVPIILPLQVAGIAP